MARFQNNNKPSYDKPSTIIGEGVKLNAELLDAKTPVQIAGDFTGNIKVDSSLVITDSGKVTGNIDGKFLLLAGEVNGNIEIREQLHITSSGKVNGDILCQSLVIDEGAKINGNCKMKSEQQVKGNAKQNSKAK